VAVSPSPESAIDRLGWLRSASDVAWRLLVVLAAIVALLVVLSRLQLVVVPIFIALLIAAALAPPTRYLERRAVPTAIATTLVFLLSLGAVAGVVALIAPEIVSEFDTLGPTLQEAGDDIEDWIVDTFDVTRRDVREYRDDLGDRISSIGSGSSGGLLTGARTVLEILAGLVLSLVLAFFFVKDARVFQRWGLAHVPVDQRDQIRASATKAWRTLGNYLIGAAAIGVIEAVVIGLAVAIAGGSLVIPVMVLTFAAAFFPIVGAIVAGAVAVLVTFVGAGFTPALIVLIVVILVQQFDTDLLAPLIYGRAVRLHPVVVLVVLTAGGAIGGIVGAFVAVPVAAVVSAVGGDLWNLRTEADPRFDPGPTPE
jgi:predicted PurR-regulated permease PerM